MTPDETIDLLSVAAAFDRRTVGEADAMAWHATLGDLDFEDSKQAVIAHYRDSREWIMPADVRTRVRAARRDRLAREVVPAPPAELADDPGRYREVLKARVREIADGKQVRLAIGPAPSEHPPPLDELRARLGPSPIPAPDRHLPPEEIARRQVAESRARRGAPLAIEPPEGELSA